MTGNESVCYNVFAECHVDTVTFHEVRVTLNKIGINFTFGKSMESEVVEDVAEVRDGDDTTLFFVVEIEGFLEIEKEVTREVV